MLINYQLCIHLYEEKANLVEIDNKNKFNLILKKNSIDKKVLAYSKLAYYVLAY